MCPCGEVGVDEHDIDIFMSFESCCKEAGVEGELLMEPSIDCNSSSSVS